MTPLEAKIIDDFKRSLDQRAVDEAIVQALCGAFEAEKLPTADSLSVLIRDRSGGPSA